MLAPPFPQRNLSSELTFWGFGGRWSAEQRHLLTIEDDCDAQETPLYVSRSHETLWKASHHLGCVTRKARPGKVIDVSAGEAATVEE